jgi:hypothetical protein
MKGGGSSAGERWFSWMPADYPEKYKSAQEILEGLGFECGVGSTGDLCIWSYDSKIGDEEIFIESICNLMEGMIEWEGEEGERYMWELGGESIHERYGRVVYDIA